MLLHNGFSDNICLAGQLVSLSEFSEIAVSELLQLFIKIIAFTITLSYKYIIGFGPTYQHKVRPFFNSSFGG
jgi:hypothetical protein